MWAILGRVDYLLEQSIWPHDERDLQNRHRRRNARSEIRLVGRRPGTTSSTVQSSVILCKGGTYEFLFEALEEIAAFDLGPVFETDLDCTSSQSANRTT